MALTYQQKLAKQGQLQAQLRSATTTTQVNSILASAKTDGIDIDPAVLKSVQNSVATLEGKAKSDAAAKAAADKAIAEKAAAAKAVTDKAQAEAKAKADAAAKAVADKAKADKAAADKAIADKAAAAKAEADRQAKVLADQAQIEADNKARVAAGLPTSNQLLTASEKAQIDRAETAAKAAAERQAAVDAANKARADAKAAKDAAFAKVQDYNNQLATVKTPGEIDAILARAKTDNVTLDQGYIDRAITGATQREAKAKAQELQTKTADYQTQVQSATTQKQLDDVLARAKTDNITIDPTFIKQANTNIKQQEATADFAKNLGPADNFTSRYLGSQEFVSMARDPVTGAEGGWYQVVGGDLQRVGADGRPTGPVIPSKEFNEQRQIASANFANYQTQQQKEAAKVKLAEEVKTFEAKLPTPGTPEYQTMWSNRYNMTGPNGQDYEPTANGGWVKSNKPLGENGRVLLDNRNYVEKDATIPYTSVSNPSAKPQTFNDIQTGFKTLAAEENAKAMAARNQLIADQKAQRDGGLFADIDKFIDKTIGWGTIATVLGSVVAGPAGAAFMSAAYTMDQGGSLEDIAKSALLSYGLSYGAEALGEALNEAVAGGVENGIIDVADASDYADAMEEIQPKLTPDAPLFNDPSIEESLNPAPDAPVVPETPVNVETPTAPVEPYTPISEGPQVPTQPRVPTDIASTGISDSAPGTIYNGPNGPEVVLDSGKTVNLADYQAAIESGQPVSVDGQMTTGVTTEFQTTGSKILEPPISPEEQLYNELKSQGYSPQEATDLVEKQFPQTGEPMRIEITGTGDTPSIGVGDATLPEVVVTASKELGLTPTQIMALGGVAAATIAVATMGAGGAATAANAAIATPSAPVAPTTPAPAPTTPVEPPVSQPPAVEPPVTAPPATEPVPPVVPPGPTTPPVTTPPVVEPVPPVVEPPVTAPPVTEPVPPTTTPPVTEPPPYEGPGIGETPNPNEVPVIDKSTPYTGPYSNESVLERFMANTLTYGDIAKLVAAGLVLPSILGLISPQGPGTPAKRSYGPIPPTDWGSAAALVNPGQNPGWFAGGFPTPAYQTTNPYQAQFYWGQQPYVGPNQPRETYNQIPAAAGTQRFGLQAGPAQYDVNQLLNQINQTALNPNFVGYSQYPTQGYVPPGTATTAAGPVLPVPPIALTGFVP